MIVDVRDNVDEQQLGFRLKYADHIGFPPYRLCIHWLCSTMALVSPNVAPFGITYLFVRFFFLGYNNIDNCFARDSENKFQLQLQLMKGNYINFVQKTIKVNLTIEWLPKSHRLKFKNSPVSTFIKL